MFRLLDKTCVRIGQKKIQVMQLH